MPGLLGKKIGMTSVFSEGKNVPCTVIEVGPCVVTQIKSVEKDGYAALQVGIEDAKDYAIFQNMGYQGLYGGLGAKEIHAKKGLKKSEKFLSLYNYT